MTKKHIPPTYLESIANELIAKYRKLDSLISHAPSKGNYHEQLLRNMIRDYLPSSFEVGEGFISNINSKTSSQLDILVVDTLDPRSFGYKEGNFFIAKDSAIACFGEVKTYCTKKDFIRSFHNLINAKKVIEDLPAVATSFIFCYDAYASKESFIKWVDDAIRAYGPLDDLSPWYFPNYVFCLKKRVFHERKAGNSPSQIQYWHAIDLDTEKKAIEQKMVECIFQCVTNGCGRIREVQGINLPR